MTFLAIFRREVKNITFMWRGARMMSRGPIRGGSRGGTRLG